MHDWLGNGLFLVGLGLTISAVLKRRSRLRHPLPAGAIRPEFAAMGEMIRPILLFLVGLLAVTTTLFYFLFGGREFLTTLDFAGMLFVLAAYSGWVVLATKRPAEAGAGDAVAGGDRGAA